MLHRDKKKTEIGGGGVSLQEEIRKLNEITERYSKVKGEVEDLEQSLPTAEELQRMEREKYSFQDDLQEVREKLKLLKGEVVMADEEARKNKERLLQEAQKHTKSPWKAVAVLELVLMLGLGSVFAVFMLKDRDGVPTGNEAGLSGDKIDKENTTSGKDSENNVLEPILPEPETYFYTENLKQLVAELDEEAIAPFTAKIEEIDDLEYLSFVYGDLKISYANEAYQPEASTGEWSIEDLTSSIISLNTNQTIRMENGSRIVVYPWEYSFAGDISRLAPEYVAYTGAEGNQLIFFCESMNGAAEEATEALGEVSEQIGLPQEIRMIDAERLWEYERLDLEAELRSLFTLEYTYTQDETAEELSVRTLMNMTVGSATYPYEISYRTYESGLFSSIRTPLYFDEFFDLKLTEEGMTFRAVVYTLEKEYLGEVSGELAVVDRELVLKNVKYGAYVSPYHEDVTSDGVIIPRTTKMQEYITISGKNRQRYYIALSDEIERVAYDMERLVQNENGYFEYFDEEGKKISFTGIDVSKYQGDIDWEQVKAAGIDYAILRLGYRGMNEGTLELDPYYEQNITKANAAGVPVGVYFFSQAITVEEAVEEAQMVLEHIEGHEVTYPIVFDTEVITTYDARANNLARDLRTDICIAFCETIEAAGYHPMIYANTKWMIMGIDMERLTEYDKWYAYYGTTFTFPYQYQMLQYSDSGSVPGIEGAVDLDISFIDYSKDFVN